MVVTECFVEREGLGDSSLGAVKVWLLNSTYFDAFALVTVALKIFQSRITVWAIVLFSSAKHIYIIILRSLTINKT